MAESKLFEMNLINTMSLRNHYVDLYRYLRNYIWDYDFIETLAALEAEVYKAFPSMAKLESYLSKMSRVISYVKNDVEDELIDELDSFLAEVKEHSDVYLDLQ